MSNTTGTMDKGNAGISSSKTDKTNNPTNTERNSKSIDQNDHSTTKTGERSRSDEVPSQDHKNSSYTKSSTENSDTQDKSGNTTN